MVHHGINHTALLGVPWQNNHSESQFLVSSVSKSPGLGDKDRTWFILLSCGFWQSVCRYVGSSLSEEHTPPPLWGAERENGSECGGRMLMWYRRYGLYHRTKSDDCNMSLHFCEMKFRPSEKSSEQPPCTFEIPPLILTYTMRAFAKYTSSGSKTHTEHPSELSRKLWDLPQESTGRRVCDSFFSTASVPVAIFQVTV